LTRALNRARIGFCVWQKWGQKAFWADRLLGDYPGTAIRRSISCAGDETQRKANRR